MPKNSAHRVDVQWWDGRSGFLTEARRPTVVMIAQGVRSTNSERFHQEYLAEELRATEAASLTIGGDPEREAAPLTLDSVIEIVLQGKPLKWERNCRRIRWCERGAAMISEQLSLAGKVAMVTGSGRGLGRAMALAMADAGADLVITARTLGEIESVGKEVEQRGRRAFVTPCDVTKTDDVESMMAKAIEALGRVDILVNNAGGSRRKPVLEMTDEEWHWVVDLNLTSTFICSRTVGRHMAVRKSGKVINIASGWGYRGLRNSTPYCASKAAVINFTRALAVEWSRHNIQVNCIAPGYFPLKVPTDEQEARERSIRISRIPLGGGEAEDIGPLAVFLASDGANYLTGQTLLLDGGALLP